MTRLIARHVVLLSLAFALSWWVVFNDPPQLTPHPPQVPDEILVALAPLAVPPTSAAQPTEAPETADPAEASERPELSSESSSEPEPEELDEPPPAPAPPPPELGSPDSEEDDSPEAQSLPERSEESDPAPESPEPQPEPGAESESLMADPNLLEAAAIELEGRGRKGFTTELIAAPEDQLEIARTFGEELVLVPFRSVAPETPDPIWFRIALGGVPSIERVSGTPPLSSYRQYRDLFDYEYSRLPSVVRELRRAVLSRNEVYLFAALIPPREWALVIGRRRQALEQTGRPAEDVRTFRIRYRRLADAGFDVDVIEILFADGTRYRPPATVEASGTATRNLSSNTETSR